MPEMTKMLSVFCADTEYADIPDAVVDNAKLAILDTLGCALGTRTEDPGRAAVINEIARRLGRSDEATIVNAAMRASAPVAALANGVICHGIDFDDLHPEALTHTSCVIFPAALASAEAANKSGSEFITSFILGFEVATRVGMAVMPSHYDYWHSTATNGTFGAAVSAGKNYGLTLAEFGHALGFAGTQAAGLLTYLEFGDYTKSLNPGKAAFNGVLSALLAKSGATAPANLIENARGYARAYSREPRFSHLVRGLEHGPMVWELLNNSAKPFPSLSASHSAIEATLDLVRENQIEPSDIEAIKVCTYDTAATHFSNPAIANSMAARLSIPYCVAASAATGRMGLDTFHASTIHLPQVQALLEKIEVVADPGLNRLYPDKMPARVKIVVGGGRSYEREVLDAKGGARRPLSTREIHDKFKLLAEPALGLKRPQHIIDAVQNLEQLEHVSSFSKLFE